MTEVVVVNFCGTESKIPEKKTEAREDLFGSHISGHHTKKTGIVAGYVAAGAWMQNPSTGILTGQQMAHWDQGLSYNCQRLDPSNLFLPARL